MHESLSAAPRIHRDRRYSSVAWRRSRDACLLRDDYRCQACGRQGQRGDRWLVADHQVPPHRYPGAFADLANLWTLCKACNNSKGDATVEEWRARSRPTTAAGSSPYTRPTPVESPRIEPVSGGRPSSGDTRRYIAWAIGLPQVAAEPEDHEHGRWSSVLQVHHARQVFGLCPDTCTRAPVRWRLPL